MAELDVLVEALAKEYPRCPDLVDVEGLNAGIPWIEQYGLRFRRQGSRSSMVLV